jgi:hypothetical protein
LPRGRRAEFASARESDPDGDAWTNTSSSLYSGLEIADECQFYGVLDGQGQGYDDVPTFLIGAHMYAVQLVYSNEQHACGSAP